MSCGKTSNAEKVSCYCVPESEETCNTHIVSGAITGIEEDLEVPNTLKSCHYKTTTTIDVDADGVYTVISTSIPPPCHTKESTENGHAHTVILFSHKRLKGKAE